MLPKNLNNKPIILFDGDCSFCNKWVDFILKKEKAPNLYFGTLKSEIGQEVIKANNIHQDIDSVIFVQEGIVYIETDAIFKITPKLKAPYSWITIFRFTPKFIRNFVYKQIAKRRLKLSKKEFCVIPSKDNKHRFLA